MKLKLQRGGFTLIEMLIATALTGMLGGIIYLILQTGVVLFAKNTAINSAHQQARIAVMQIETDIHSAVSLTQLVDENRNAVSGTGPAAGISFQQFAAGPFKLTEAATAGATQLKMDFGTYVPKANQRLILPDSVEVDITADCPGTGSRLVNISPALTTGIKTQYDLNSDGDTTDSGDQVTVLGVITDRTYYVVQSGELRYYGRRSSGSYNVMATNITSATPFSTPTTASGTPYSRFVSAINLSTADPTANARGFRSANMFLNAEVPLRAKLCDYK